jgi:hypothetical protein
LNPLASALGLSCPTAGLSQLGQTGYAGIPNVGIHPAQLQLASLLASQQGAIPQVLGQSPILQNPYAAVQNPWITGVLQNPLLTAGLQNPLLTAGLQNPLLTSGLQNPLLQNPLLQNPLLNPFAQQQFGLQQFQHPLYQQIGQVSPYGQQVSPYGQIGSPFGQFGLPYGQIGPQQNWQQQQPLQAYSPYQQIGQGSPFGVQSSPYTQMGSPFIQHSLPYGQVGSPLAPQSWVGQAGQFAGGQGFGQIHPLLAQQLVARALHSQGISPWVGF